MNTPTIVTKKVSELKEAPYNPRMIENTHKKGLEESMRRFGIVQSLVYNKRTGYVVGGNQRLRILKENGVEEVPVIEVDLDEIEEKALNLALNNFGIQGAFTTDVQEIIDQIKKFDVGMYDTLRLFSITSPLQDEMEKEEKEKAQVPGMQLLPFEHYDYVVVLCQTTQEWYWLCEFLGIGKVNASPVGETKIGIGRGITAQQLRQALEAKGIKLNQLM